MVLCSTRSVESATSSLVFPRTLPMPRLPHHLEANDVGSFEGRRGKLERPIVRHMVIVLLHSLGLLPDLFLNDHRTLKNRKKISRVFHTRSRWTVTVDFFWGGGSRKLAEEMSFVSYSFITFNNSLWTNSNQTRVNSRPHPVSSSKDKNLNRNRMLE